MSHGGARRNAGRKRVAPANASKSTTRRRARDAQTALDLQYAELGNDYEALKKLFLKKTKEFVGKAAKKLIQQYAHNEEIANNALDVLKNPPGKMTPDDALQLLLRVDLSKHQYQLLRSMVNNAANLKNLIPSYDIVRAQKAIAMPRNPAENYSEQKAEVRLQDLLEHTCRRAVLCNEDLIKATYEHSEENINCVFTITYGGDGAGQQQIYQQKHNTPANKGKKDDSMFAAVINPLVLQTEDEQILWKNSCSQSPLFCRPFLLEYEKETEEYVKRTFRYINDQIANLAPVEIELSDSVSLVIRFRMICSLIDGKMFCHIVNVPFTSCPICEIDRTALQEYNLQVEQGNFVPQEGRLVFSLQSFHALLNMTSVLIRVECKRVALRARNRARAANPNMSSADLQKIYRDAGNARKQAIIAEFKQNDLHLTQMITGNMARAMLGPRRDLTARILHIDPRIINRFRIILICLNTTEYMLNRPAFKRYCEDTRNLFLQLYPWYAITPTLHKVLEHSVECEEALDLCLGTVSEGGAENQHRIRKLIRRFRARKTSRKDNLTDIFNRCLHMSDPLLATKYSVHLEKFRSARREHPSMEIPEEARDLLDIRRPRRVRRPRARRNSPPVIAEQQPAEVADMEDMEDMEDAFVILDNDGDSSDDEGEWLGDDFLDE